MFFVRKLIQSWLFVAETADRITNGRDMPKANAMKLNKLNMNENVDVLSANNIINDAGLHGRTIAPKKNPNKKKILFRCAVGKDKKWQLHPTHRIFRLAKESKN